MAEKVLVLNSGGFDSVTLMHYVKKEYGQDIVSVFFDYGQKNHDQEYQCAKRVADKLGAEFKNIKLPKFKWSSNGLTEDKEVNKENDYVHMRNLIFLSYALSIAEAKGCTRIYSAFVDTSESSYNDTSKQFQKNIRKLFNDSTGIKFDVPFKSMTKHELSEYAWKYAIKENDFFSCNHPVGGKPCGTCDDCKSLVSVNKHLKSRELPIYKWIHTGYKYSEEFDKAYMDSKIVEMRVHNNNVCNFKCSHCYYGFEDAYGPDLTDEQWKKVFDESMESGINQFHFCGKEPVLTKNLWTLAEYLKGKGARYDFVTNGSTIKHHIQKIKDLGFYRVCVSVDSLGVLTIRDLPTAEGAIKLLREADIPVTVFIDCHVNNYLQIKDMMTTLIEKYNVQNFYVRPVQYFGGGKEVYDIILKPEEWYEVIEQVYEVSLEFPEGTTAVLSQPSSMLESLYHDESYPMIKHGIIEVIENYGVMMLNDNLRFFVDFFQATFLNQLTVTSDGYVVGLGTDMSNPKYYEDSPGNVLEHHVVDLVQKGRREHLDWMKNTVCNPNCSICRHGSRKDFYCYSNVVDNF